MLRNFAITAALIFTIGGGTIWSFLDQSQPDDTQPPIDAASLVPNWSAISAWPGATAETGNAEATSSFLGQVEANPDPAQVTTLILLDDSGSMGGRMGAAKDAVIQAVSQFPPESRVGVVALNAGLVLPVSTAAAAARELPGQLTRIEADGTTPLGARLAEALVILTQEAQKRRGFGVFRILVTTDGAASDGLRMNRAVAEILSTTPIELATIGVGIGEGHALNVPGYTSYVNVNSVGELAAALTAAAAEQTVFDPITSFED